MYVKIKTEMNLGGIWWNLRGERREHENQDDQPNQIAARIPRIF